SGSKSSNAPFISTTTINNAYKCVTANTNCQTLHMNANQGSFRGTMTWSINWDVYAQQAGITLPVEVDMASVKSNMGACTPRSCGTNCRSLSDGCGGTLNCPACGAGQTCNSSNVCVSTCTPKTCAQVGATCGSPSDGCGGTLSCGSCTSPKTCNSGFQCVDTS